MATSDLVCVDDYERRALSMLDSRYADFFATGSDEEQTLTDNKTDFKSLRLRPRVLVDVSNISLRTTILGSAIDFPICIAPTAQHKLAHPLGETATAKAADSMNACYCMSSAAHTAASEIGSLYPQLLRWFQLYVFKDKTLTKALIERAEQSGFTALVLTADMPVLGNRRKMVKNKFQRPPHLKAENLDGFVDKKFYDENTKEPKLEDSLTWQDVKRIISMTTLPVIVKGILTGEDADKAIQVGCSAIYVSNHGGRQLDGVSSTIAALPEVVKAVDGRVEVYIDGGIRTGTDVLKALALGAKAVFIGRPVIYGLTVNGEEGGKRVLTLLKDELRLAMQLSGVTDVLKTPANLIIHESAISRL